MFREPALITMDVNILMDFPKSHKESSGIINQLPPSHSKLSSFSSATRRSVSFASFSGSENVALNDPEPSEVYNKLCMAPPKVSRRSRQSLSFLGNGRSAEERPDGKPESIDDLIPNVAEEQARTIIDQEIFEWRFVCGTGRPFWWSPESGYKSAVPIRHCPRFSHKETDDSSSLDCKLEKAELPEHINDLDSKDEVAYNIALQLLSACFTLPPTSLNLPTPDYTLLPNVPDFRMISSLRMHTHYRYSPSFGHNARNTTPIEGWSSCEDFTCLPSPSAIDKQIATLKNFKTSSRRSRGRQRRNTSRVLLHRRSSRLESTSIESTSSQTLDEAPYRKAALALFDASSKQSKLPAQKAPTIKYSDDKNLLHQKKLSNMKYSLQPVIHSEPHHVYIQPVRELVVNKCDRSRRNFGGSLCAPLPSRRSEEMESMTSESGVTSSLIIDRKLRRRRAQERGDIYSSVDDEAPNNSLASNRQGSEAGASDVDLRVAKRSDRTTERSDAELKCAETATKTLPERASRSCFSSNRLKLCRTRRKSCLSEMLTHDDFPSPEPLETTERMEDGIFETRMRALSHTAAGLDIHDVSKTVGGVIALNVGLHIPCLTLSPGKAPRSTGSSAIAAHEDCEDSELHAHIVHDVGEGQPKHERTADIQDEGRDFEAGLPF